jgi:hypothetical protein
MFSASILVVPGYLASGWGKSDAQMIRSAPTKGERAVNSRVLSSASKLM